MRDPLAMTPARLRLRVMTAIVLVVVIAMMFYGTHAPFLRLPHTFPATGVARRAMAVRALMVLTYWTTCIFLGLSLFVVAWLDLRALRRGLMEARMAVWRETMDRSDRGQHGGGEA